MNKDSIKLLVWFSVLLLLTSIAFFIFTSFKIENINSSFKNYKDNQEKIFELSNDIQKLNLQIKLLNEGQKFKIMDIPINNTDEELNVLLSWNSGGNISDVEMSKLIEDSTFNIKVK